MILLKQSYGQDVLPSCMDRCYGVYNWPLGSSEFTADKGAPPYTKICCASLYGRCSTVYTAGFFMGQFTAVNSLFYSLSNNYLYTLYGQVVICID